MYMYMTVLTHTKTQFACGTCTHRHNQGGGRARGKGEGELTEMAPWQMDWISTSCSGALCTETEEEMLRQRKTHFDHVTSIEHHMTYMCCILSSKIFITIGNVNLLARSLGQPYFQHVHVPIYNTS